jgi:hypothetical protein
MIANLTTTPTPLDDALYALALAGPVPDADALDELVRQYPEHATELTDIAIELALDALDDDEGDGEPMAAPGTSVAVSKAMSRFNNRLYEIETAPPRAPSKNGVALRNPFATLEREQLRALGHRLQANTVFAIKLRDRIIDDATMTDGFKRLVADELPAPPQVVAAHFAGDSAIGTNIEYKSDRKPRTGNKQTFEEAVRTSGLTAEQQAYLMSL